jgi:hypothetical protein
MTTGNIVWHPRRRVHKEARMKKIFVLTAIPIFLTTFIAACAMPAQPNVHFTEPQNGATISNPVKLKWAAQNFRVEPAGAVNAGAGHLHVMVNTPCVAAGQVVPHDDAYKHFGKAQMEAELTLPPGQHTLCLQAADGAHVALVGAGMTQQISIVVK